MDNEPNIEREPFLREFMSRHNITDEQMRAVAEERKQPLQPAKRPPQHRQIPTCPPHFQRANRDFFGGKGGDEHER